MPWQPARQATLQQWFAMAGQDLRPGDRLLIFVTDHGTKNPQELDNAAMSLWHEQLSVAAFRRLLPRLQPGVQTVMLMNQCSSGCSRARVPSPFCLAFTSAA